MNSQNRRIVVEENKMKEEIEKVCSLKGAIDCSKQQSRKQIINSSDYTP
jgi:hypothetical protein